ncbi:MAG: ABC transporter ATP-binding protein [Actinomycetia bacterium]|nr:ABC transporter ATP-binding protein [Actinomycetes bacterium]
MAVDLRQVTKTYATGGIELDALSDVSLSIEEGEFISIMGPSGSGKSTLMNIIGLLDRPTFGNYWLAGQDTSVLTERELAAFRARTIGFVFQSFNLLSRTSVLKNVVLPLEYTGVPRAQRRARAEAALAAAGLDPEVFMHKSNEISGGQMQRVAIARALVNDPAIVLADEPTGNLDSKTGQAVLNMFGELNRAGRTIILITHDPAIACHAQRTVHLLDGRLYEGAEVAA